MNTDNGVTRSFAKPSKLRRKFLGLPLGAWAILVALTGVVAAQVIGPSLSRTQNVQVVTLAVNGLAGSDVLTPIIYGTVDIVTLDAANSGSTSIAGFYVSVSIAFGDSCTTLQSKLQDSSGTPGHIEIALSATGAVGTYASVTIPTSTAIPCVVDNNAVGYPALISLGAGANPNAFSMKYAWVGTPTTNPGTWTFTPSK